MDTLKTRSAADVQHWLVSYVARELQIPREHVTIDEEFVNMGLSSRQAIIMTDDLEAVIGEPMDPALLWDFPTIRQLADHLGRPAPQG